MRIGIFESVFPRPTLDASFQAVKEAGFSSVQFDYASAGLGLDPQRAPESVVSHVHDVARGAGVDIAAVSGTFNMVHPDAAIRERGLAALDAIASTCRVLGTSIVTLCTGTRDATSMWQAHPDNGSPGAWTDLLGCMEAALAIADRHDVQLVIEPEPANVVRNADRALALIEEMADPPLKVVLDPANILAGDPDRTPAAALDHAFDLLGDHIILAHAKDLDAAGSFCAAGTGIVPWDHYGDLLREISFAGDVIFHSLTERQVPTARRVIEAYMDRS